MVEMVPRQYFHLRKCACSAVAVKGEAVEVGLADVPQSCQQNLPYLCRVQSALMLYCGKAYSIRDK